MGLFSKSEGTCYFCKGTVVAGQNGVVCHECDTFIHADCLKSHGLTQHDGKLIRRDRVHIRCPSCGYEGKIKV